jgi:hypothetical protein
MVSREQFDRANARAEKLQASTPRVVAARYDKRANQVAVTLENGLDVAFSPRNVQGLESARPEDLVSIEITPSGFGLHFPKLDADLYVPAMLEGLLGSRRWMAARMGARGGKARSAAKAAASRENGKLGGRPKMKASRVSKAKTQPKARRAKRPHARPALGVGGRRSPSAR